MKNTAPTRQRPAQPKFIFCGWCMPDSPDTKHRVDLNARLDKARILKKGQPLDGFVPERSARRQSPLVSRLRRRRWVDDIDDDIENVDDDLSDAGKEVGRRFAIAWPRHRRDRHRQDRDQ